MMRFAFLVALCACSAEQLDSPKIDVRFPEAEAAGGVIPFRTGGSFQVKVIGQQSELGKSSHATVEIVNGTISADATASTVVALADQSDGTLAGTAFLKWPTGEAPRVRVSVASTNSLLNVPLEPPALGVVPGSLSNTGAQLVQSLCFDSSSTDGTLALHLAGAALDSGIADGTVPLLPGTCAGSLDPKNPSSSARVKVFVSDSSVQVFATQPPTMASVVFKSTPASAGTLTLELAPGSLTPVRGSIVDVTATAKVDGTPRKDIFVSFQSLPSVTLVPVTAKTDASGMATASFQMPADGSLRMTAISGNVQSNAVTYWQ